MGVSGEAKKHVATKRCRSSRFAAQKEIFYRAIVTGCPHTTRHPNDMELHELQFKGISPCSFYLDGVSYTSCAMKTHEIIDAQVQNLECVTSCWLLLSEEPAPRR